MNYLIVDDSTGNIILQYLKNELFILKIQFNIMMALMFIVLPVILTLNFFPLENGIWKIHLISIFCVTFLTNAIIFIVCSSGYTVSIMKRSLELIGKTELLRSI